MQYNLNTFQKKDYRGKDLDARDIIGIFMFAKLSKAEIFQLAEEIDCKQHTNVIAIYANKGHTLAQIIAEARKIEIETAPAEAELYTNTETINTPQGYTVKKGNIWIKKNQTIEHIRDKKVYVAYLTFPSSQFKKIRK